MSDYIKRETVMERLADFNAWCKDARLEGAKFVEDCLIPNVPSADVVERKRGEWQITDPYPHNVYCSNCYKTFAQR